MRSTNSQQLENWLGKETIERVSLAMRGVQPEWRWYGPPIAMAQTPGAVYATSDGDFVGKVQAGKAASAQDYIDDQIRRFIRAERARIYRNIGGRRQAGVVDLDSIINARWAGGKARKPYFQKVGTTGVSGGTNSLWRVGAQPSAGANASNAPGGDAPTDATTGAFPFTNPAGGEEQRLLCAWISATVGDNTMLLYDRIFQVNKTMSSTGTEAVTGVPSRYQSATDTDDDAAAGNFLFVEVGAALSATAHNWTVCQYTDQAGNTGVTLPSLTGNSGAIINRLDHPTGQWFAPLAAGDYGIKALTQMQCSASVTGTINFVIGHPIAWFPLDTNFRLVCFEQLGTAFDLERIFDDAALAFLEVLKPSTTATTYNGQILTLDVAP